MSEPNTGDLTPGISILMPVYNEIASISAILDRVKIALPGVAKEGCLFLASFFLLMIFALLAGWQRRRLEVAVSALIVLVALYVGASRGDYTFGDSFGSRQSIELLPLLMVPLAGAIACALKSRWKWAAASLLVFLIAVNAVQFWGYTGRKLLHNNNTRITYARFWANTLGLPAIERYMPPAQ